MNMNRKCAAYSVGFVGIILHIPALHFFLCNEITLTVHTTCMQEVVSAEEASRVSAFICSTCPNLQSLAIRGYHVHPSIFQAFASSDQATSKVKELEIFVSDELDWDEAGSPENVWYGDSLLDSAAKLSSLQQLCLQGCGLLWNLSCLSGLRKLHKLCLRDMELKQLNEVLCNNPQLTTLQLDGIVLEEVLASPFLTTICLKQPESDVILADLPNLDATHLPALCEVVLKGPCSWTSCGSVSRQRAAAVHEGPLELAACMLSRLPVRWEDGGSLKLHAPVQIGSESEEECSLQDASLEEMILNALSPLQDFFFAAGVQRLSVKGLAFATETLASLFPGAEVVAG